MKATNGDTHLGGEDFDQRIIDAIAESFQKEHNVDLRKDRMALQRLKEAAEKAKHELIVVARDRDQPAVHRDERDGRAAPPREDDEAHRARAAHARTSSSARSSRVKKALADAKLTPSDIDKVVLVGGMTRMPAVQKAVKEFFGKDPHKGVNPDEVVAVGAALQGAALAGEASTRCCCST